MEYIALWTATGCAFINTINFVKREYQKIRNSISALLPILCLEVFLAALIEYYVEIK